MADSSDTFFDRLAPILLVGLALMGGYYRQIPLTALASTLLFMLLLSRTWSRHALRDVSYQRETNEDRAFPGDELQLVLRLTNDKLLPLPWVEVDDRMPPQIIPIPEGGAPSLARAAGELRLAGTVSWKARILWRYRLACRRRGIYQVGPAVVTSGDPFGFFPRSSTVGEIGRLVIYPRLVPLESLGLPPGFPVGEARAERTLFENPSRTVGVRDYRPEDPFRRIHWKATARRQELQVKIHEATTTLEVALFLAVDTFQVPDDAETSGHGDAEESGIPPPHPSPITHDSSPDFELAVSVAASVAHRLIRQGYPVGLYLNGGAEGATALQQLPPGCSQEQLINVLELLAGVQPVRGISSALLLEEVAPRLPWGSSVVVVAGSLPETLLAALQDLGSAGQKPAVLLVGKGDEPEAYPGVAIHRVTGNA